MSFPGGEFDAQQPTDRHEEEKARGTRRRGMAPRRPSSSSSPLLSPIDEEGGEEVPVPQQQQLRPPRPRGPLPSSVKAPKPLSRSPVLNDRLKKEGSFSSFLHPDGGYPASEDGSDPGPSHEGFDHELNDNFDHEFDNARSDRGDRAGRRPGAASPASSAASLVVCGVDGTVYTLDAYTGQLRGMFASGSALVFSSSPGDEKEDTNTGSSSSSSNGNNNDNDINNNNDADGRHEELAGDKSNAIVTNTSPGWKERVVPGLDGQLYSLFETVEDTPAHGDDSTLDFESCQADYDGDVDDLDDACRPPASQGRSMRSHDETGSSSSVIPRMGTYNLTPLPISAMDVVDSPISTCRPIGDDPQQEQCGIIVGAKKTTIYAVDPLTGKVQWTQDPMGGAGGRGYTKHPPKNDASRGRTVLLQREDYAVRHLNTEGGEEVWKVELGRFSALDFDVDAAGGGRNGGGASPPSRRGAGPDAHEDDDVLGGDAMAAGGDHVVGGRRRGAAAVAASEKKKGGVPPILGGRRKGSLHDFDSVFGDDAQATGGGGEDCLFGHHEDDFVHDHSHFRGFPSVAFGEDGTSVMAVDGISGELLWKRRIESVVTAVYGVGKESSWIPLDVIDESDVFSHGHSTPLSTSPRPTSSPHSGGLVPYGAGQMESGKLHRLGRHHSNLFVSSKFDPLGGHDSDPFSQPGADDLPYENEIGAPLPPRVGGLEQESLLLDGHITMNPSELPTNGVKPPASHRTENGLYLTWSMVAAIVLMLLSVIVFVARVIILRQKRKLASASVDMTTASSSSQEGRQRAQSSGGDFLSADGRNLTEPLAGNIWLKNGKHPAVTRSVSLDALGSNSFGSPGTNVAPNLISEKLRPIIPPPNLSSVTRPRLQSTDRGTSTTAPNTLSPTVPRSMTLPLETSPPNARSTQQQAQPGVDNIDGVPLVRYSRYRSEFKEMSALGRGGFGTVFQCENVLDSREYAIKKIKIVSQLGMDGIATKRFSQKLHRVLREVKILALLDHPNIVRYYTAWLEVDDGIQNEDDDTNFTSSMYDKKSNGIFSSSLFSGLGSRSLSPKKSIQQRRTKGLLGSYNPLGWNNFGSFRLDEPQSEASSSFGTQQNDAPFTSPPSDDGEDLGFTWERSNENTAGPSLNAKNQGPTKILEHSVKEESKSSESTDKTPKASKSKSATRSKCDKKNSLSLTERQKDEDCEKKITEGRHILFIQMQLCSSQTLADFLANRQARTGAVSQSLSEASTYAVDIPFALRLFAQIAHGVKYVHKQGLIHRDLKPQNCFIDEAGNAKVGDFGLSRESASAGDITDFDESAQEDTPAFVDAENTAGVGTRAYASPEQMRGSNYDASTDVYSLGIILFELCYPMYTAMERYKEFSGIRKGVFPSYWDSHVKSSFPTMHDLLVQMISISAAERPSADAVSDHMDSLLREYSVQSLDKSWGKKGALLLRVETEEKDGVLASAMKLIKESAPDSKILQYGLRGQAARAIMEFALQIKDDDRKASVQRISSRLHDHAMNVRQLSDS